MEALSGDNVAVLECLLDRGADVNIRDNVWTAVSSTLYTYSICLCMKSSS